MSFKILKTVEDDTVRLSIVPTNWEQDGILYWPPKHIKNGEKLITDPNSIPTIDWLKMACTVKEKNLESLVTAKKICALYSSLPDTDAEIEYFERNKKTHERRGKKRFCKQNTSRYEDVESAINFNYNSEFEIIENEEGDLRDEASTATPTVTSLPNETVIYVNSLDNNNVPLDDDDVFFMSACSENIPNVSAETNSKNCALLSKLEEMDNKINALGVKLDYFIKSNAEVKTLLQEVLRRTNNGREIGVNNVKAANEEGIISESEFNLFPLDNTIAIDELEHKLANREFERKMFSHFTNIGGKSGKQNGEKVAARLISELFSNSVLCRYTWKGISTAKTDDGRPTVTFIKYEKIISFLFKVLQEADQKFSRLATEKYLQLKVFKRNSQRLKREINNKTKRKVSAENSEDLDSTPVEVEDAVKDDGALITPQNLDLTAVEVENAIKDGGALRAHQNWDPISVEIVELVGNN